MMNAILRHIMTNPAFHTPGHEGYRWRQPIAWRERLVMNTLWTTGIVAPIIGYTLYCWLRDVGRFYFNFGSILFVTVFVISIVLFVACLILSCRDWTDEYCGVTLTVDDEVLVTKPRRLGQEYYDLNWMRLRHGVSDITSIERVPMKNRAGGHYRHGGDDGYLAYDVWIYFLNGQRFPVGSYLNEADAHVVVVQLNLALRKTREATARAA